MKYTNIALGGTFDHFHVGHEQFVLFAAAQAEHLIIGITDTSLTKSKKNNDVLEPLYVRKNKLEKFCAEHHFSCSIPILSDTYGPTLSDTSIQALCVTESTLNGAAVINAERKKRGLTELPVLVAPLALDTTGHVISSERIRSGEINRKGVVYAELFTKDLQLTPQQRAYFGQPQGTVITEPTMTSWRCLVGDSTIETFLHNNWPFDLAIFDYKKKRVAYTPQLISQEKIDVSTTNPAGSITANLADAILTAYKKNLRYLFVEGEEDLAAVAATLLLPLGTSIYYGQPDVGIIETTVDEQKKDAFYSVLSS